MGSSVDDFCEKAFISGVPAVWFCRVYLVMFFWWAYLLLPKMMKHLESWWGWVAETNQNPSCLFFCSAPWKKMMQQEGPILSLKFWEFAYFHVALDVKPWSKPTTPTRLVVTNHQALAQSMPTEWGDSPSKSLCEPPFVPTLKKNHTMVAFPTFAIKTSTKCVAKYTIHGWYGRWFALFFLMMIKPKIFERWSTLWTNKNMGQRWLRLAMTMYILSHRIHVWYIYLDLVKFLW